MTLRTVRPWPLPRRAADLPEMATVRRRGVLRVDFARTAIVELSYQFWIAGTNLARNYRQFRMLQHGAR